MLENVYIVIEETFTAQSHSIQILFSSFNKLDADRFIEERKEYYPISEDRKYYIQLYTMVEEGCFPCFDSPWETIKKGFKSLAR